VQKLEFPSGAQSFTLGVIRTLVLQSEDNLPLKSITMSRGKVLLTPEQAVYLQCRDEWNRTEEERAPNEQVCGFEGTRVDVFIESQSMNDHALKEGSNRM
jgi:hypothetical protein